MPESELLPPAGPFTVPAGGVWIGVTARSFAARLGDREETVPAGLDVVVQRENATHYQISFSWQNRVWSVETLRDTIADHENGPAAPDGSLTYPAWGDSFLSHFRNSGNVRWSCEQTIVPGKPRPGISRQTYWRYKKHCPAFAAALQGSHEDVADLLEARLFEMALKGPLGTPNTFRALQLALRAHAPERYNLPRLNEHSGPGGGPIALNEVNLAALRQQLNSRLLSEPAPEPTPELSGEPE